MKKIQDTNTNDNKASATILILDKFLDTDYHIDNYLEYYHKYRAVFHNGERQSSLKEHNNSKCA